MKQAKIKNRILKKKTFKAMFTSMYLKKQHQKKTKQKKKFPSKALILKIHIMKKNKHLKMKKTEILNFIKK